MCNSTPKVHFNFPLNSHRNKFFDTRISTLSSAGREEVECERCQAPAQTRANNRVWTRASLHLATRFELRQKICQHFDYHQSKRSRSASEEPWDSSTIATSGLEIRGSESQIHPEPSSPSHQGTRPRRLTKVGIREREMRLSKQKTNIGGCMKICKSDMVGL